MEQTKGPGGNGAARMHGRERHVCCPHGNDGPGFAEGRADKLDKGSADGAGLDEGLGVGTDDGARLAEVLAELEARQSEVEALRAELDEFLLVSIILVVNEVTLLCQRQ